MNREILFRGQKLHTKEWVYGYYSPRISNVVYIGGVGEDYRTIQANIKDANGSDWLVDENTVGQFTGLCDKNNNKIFEGDIVITRYDDGELCTVGDIQFDCGVFGAEWVEHKETRCMVGNWGQRHNLKKLDDGVIYTVEVVGNIYDNPELLSYTNIRKLENKITGDLKNG